jgi:hypothetical protein
MELSDILEVTDDLTTPRWVECPEVPGFAILLRLPDVPGLRGIASAAGREALTQAAETGGEPELDIDFGAISLKLSDYAVRDWRGLTGAGLRHWTEKVKNLNIKTAPETVIPFDRQILHILLKWSPTFYEFVDQAWQDITNQGLQNRENDEKNSLSAPATTPTPAPDNAAGASKKKTRSK